MAFLNDNFVTKLSGWRLLILACFMAIGIKIIKFFIDLYHIRSKFQRMQRDGLPMPPHHPIFGHLKLVGEIVSRLPKDVHRHVLPHQIKLLYPNLGPLFYLDTWPFGGEILVAVGPDSAYQMTQAHPLPKFDAMKEYLKPMTGGNDLVSMEGKEWRKWRTIFNPGFAAGHLMTLVPDLMKDMSIFCEILRKAATNSDIVIMDHLTTRLNLDIISRMALDTHLNSQLETNDFVSALLSQLDWLSFGHEVNPFQRYNPIRPLVNWWNGRQMVKYIWRELDMRLKRRNIDNKGTQSTRSRSIIDLALDNYLASKSRDNNINAMDTAFRDIATSQLRVFIFAGHDTTSSTMCYALHLLWTNPKTRQLLIAEHDTILGPDHKEAARKITEDPYILNRLPYTMAVAKETLRLYPSASTARSGEPGYFMSGIDGLQYPTEGFMVWSNSHAIQRDPLYWPQPSEFLPERWIVEEGHYLYPKKGTFRPFEFGPRKCIGQELAMLEMKIFLVLTSREFEIRSVYEEWDSLHSKTSPRTVEGDRAYQILSGAAHPSEGLPCRVKLVGN
ncbi:hypothetical protein EAE96_000331 [Botrytis aclada]|nr:hypothetical protein EAE96_000331 [Botrytis aclada]